MIFLEPALPLKGTVQVLLFDEASLSMAVLCRYILGARHLLTSMTSTSMFTCARVQVVTEWLAAAKEESEEQLLWEVQQVPAAVAQQQRWLLRSGLRLWITAHHAWLEEKAAEARRLQTWQQVSSWLGELQENQPRSEQQPDPAEAMAEDDSWLESALPQAGFINPQQREYVSALAFTSEDALKRSNMHSQQQPDDAIGMVTLVPGMVDAQTLGSERQVAAKAPTSSLDLGHMQLQRNGTLLQDDCAWLEDLLEK